MIRFLNSCQNSGVLRTLCNQGRHVPTMQYKFMRERIVATLKECVASPSFTLLGGRNTAGSTPTTSRGAPTTAVTSLTTRPAGSNARCRYRTSSGGTGSGSGAPRSSNPGRSSRDRNVRALEATTEASSFDDDSSLEAMDDFVVAKLNGDCLGGCGVDHPPYECPSLLAMLPNRRKPLPVLAANDVLFLFGPLLLPTTAMTMMSITSISMTPTTKILIRIWIFHRADYVCSL